MTSHRQIFRSSAIIGGASVIKMIIGIVKVKVVALLLGPAGIGLMGLYENIMSMAAMLSGCGMASSGVRQVTASADDAETLAIVRRALWLGSLMLGSAGMAILWLLSEPVARLVFGDSIHASEVAWLGFGLLLTVISGSQTALLQGLRRINDLARVSIFTGLAAAPIGILVLYLLGNDGVLWFVLTAPAVNFFVVRHYAGRLPQSDVSYDLKAIQLQWLAMLKLGIPLMSAGLFMLATQLAVRSILFQKLGLEASGFFQAVWVISVTYVGFALNALAMDFYPRLTKAIADHGRAGKLVNEQAEMALLFIGPALIAIITLAPLVIQLLYSHSFSPAAEILRWQALGDIFKVASVPMVFIFLAKGHGGVAVGFQLLWSAIYLGVLLLGITRFGLVIAGVSFGAAYVIYYIAVVIVANRLIGFKQTMRNWLFSLLLSISAITVIFLSAQSVVAGYVIGLLATFLVSAYSLHRLDQLINLTGWLRHRFL